MTEARVTSRPPRRTASTIARSGRVAQLRAPVTRGSTARQLAPAPSPRSAPRRTQLAVVDRKGVLRQRFVRWGLRSVLGATLVLVFLAVALHAELASQQGELQQVRNKVTAEQTRFGNLRLQVAELSAPERVITEAGRLGLVTPPFVTYLPSSGPTVGPEASNGSNDWSQVKPNLVARP